MRLRSSVTLEERQKLRLEELKKKGKDSNARALKYSGKIRYVKEYVSCVVMRDKIINRANVCPRRSYVIGLGVDWPYISPGRGQSKFCFLQLCYSPTECCVVQITKKKNVEKALTELMTHPSVVIAGVNIQNTLKKLTKEFPQFNTDEVIHNCIDLGVLANNVLPSQQKWTLETLLEHVYKMRYDKNKKNKVMDKWFGKRWTLTYLKHCCTEAYASFVLYLLLKELMDNMENQAQAQQNNNLN